MWCCERSVAMSGRPREGTGNVRWRVWLTIDVPNVRFLVRDVQWDRVARSHVDL